MANIPVPASLSSGIALLQAYLNTYGNQVPVSLTQEWQSLEQLRSQYITLVNNPNASTDPRLQAEISSVQAQYQQAMQSTVGAFASQFGTSDPNVAQQLSTFQQNNPGWTPPAQTATPTTPTSPSPGTDPNNPYGLDLNFSGGVTNPSTQTSNAPPPASYTNSLMTGAQLGWSSDQPMGNIGASSAAPPNGLSADGQTLNETVNGITSSLNFTTAEDIINSALQTVGLDPSQVATSGVNIGQTLTQYFWSQIVNQGITDAGTIGEMIGTLLPSTGQFQVAFPGYQKALQNGYVRTVAEYVSAEEGITSVMLQGGVPKALINPQTVGNLIANGVSVNEAAARVNNGLDAALNAPAEVQNMFAQEFGAGNGPAALATVFLNPNIDAVTLQKMLAGAEIRGAAAASNLTISQGLSQRLADQGQTYASAQAQFKNLTAQAGLFQQTVGEQSSQAPVPGTQNANMPLSESQQGVEAAFGLNSNAVQQVHQEALSRQNEFRGGGGASTTQQEGYSGLAAAKPF